MTAIAMDSTVRPRPARMWRAVLLLHRAALIGWVVFVTAVSGGLLWAYGPGGNTARADWQRQCTGDACSWSSAITLYHAAYTVAELLIGWIPYLAAVWAGTFVARELERGTTRLAWTQSVSPTRWLATTLAVPAALVTAGSTLMVLLHRLLFDAHQVPLSWNQWNDETFTANGTLAIVYPLLGLAVGTLAGFLQRHVLTAAGLSIAAMALAVTTLGFARPYLWPTVTRVTNVGIGYDAPPNVLNVDQGAVTATGAHVTDTCFADTKCLKAVDITGYYVDYHPASHFWPLQLVETGIVVALAALVLAVAFTLLRRRTG
ncbi:hypothetical protein JHN63_47520 [Streptomyces sp. MBT65]|uniref:hypothetical protein n=1 Tax=Streptomyces sp. MBT65 TaxID=1488395 RepID=UPI00190A84CB|nr:hypothetical protein [Streptomyces sp. MBT65]MBK3581292.1 hypothetical protein [Streptomyces sp. MBT65]